MTSKPCGCTTLERLTEWEEIKYCTVHKSAPELLEALQALVVHPGCGGSDARQIALDAIAKAKGEK